MVRIHLFILFLTTADPTYLGTVQPILVIERTFAQTLAKSQCGPLTWLPLLKVLSKSADFLRVWIELLPSNLDDKTFSPFLSSTRQYLAAVFCLHSSSESMHFFASFATWLICTFHVISPLIFRNKYDKFIRQIDFSKIGAIRPHADKVVKALNSQPARDTSFPDYRLKLENFHQRRGADLDFSLSWQQIKQNIISKNSKNQPLLMWFEPAEFIGIEPRENGVVFKLSVPSALHQYWISQHLLETISSEVSAIYPSSFHIELIVVKQDTPELPLIQELNPGSNLSTEGPVLRSPQTPNSGSLNSEYTFSSFVVGRNNEFAHAVSFSIAKNPGTGNYNPLFICGPTGMGKTHLLNAVGNYIRENSPHLRICYCSAEKFLIDCISSIRRSEMHKFRQKYRENCDLLLMDDIQVLNRGEAVQEEFFHTLNDFFEKGQQVIVASDRMPKDIDGLEDRIRTRLEWGLIADIQMPDLETRVAILRYKAERNGVVLPSEVVSYLARISKTSIRQLEGNLKKIKMFAELQGLPISLELTKKILASHDDARNLTMDDLQKLVADHYRLRVVDLKGKSRSQPLVTARQICMFLAKKHLDKSYVEIGRSFGGRDHSTVINAMQRTELMLSSDADIKRDFNDIESRIHNITGV